MNNKFLKLLVILILFSGVVIAQTHPKDTTAGPSVKRTHSSSTITKKKTTTKPAVSNGKTSTKKTYRKSTVIKKDTVN